MLYIQISILACLHRLNNNVEWKIKEKPKKRMEKKRTMIGYYNLIKKICINKYLIMSAYIFEYNITFGHSQSCFLPSVH